MTDGVDPRLARRRRQVQEASARRRLRWMVMLLALAILTGVVVAVFQSSWFSVDSINVEGERQSEVLAILSEAGIEEGVSIVSVRAGRAEELLRDDPWIAEAAVRVVWPRSVEVMVVEHIPIAQLTVTDTTAVVSGQGVVLSIGETLVQPRIDIDGGALTVGGVVEDPVVLAALEFVASLPIELKTDLVVALEEDLLIALVHNHRVELGGPREMTEKALTLAALFDDGLEEGAVVNLLAPSRPAVTNPQPVVETSDEVTTETSPSS